MGSYTSTIRSHKPLPLPLLVTPLQDDSGPEGESAKDDAVSRLEPIVRVRLIARLTMRLSVTFRVELAEGRLIGRRIGGREVGQPEIVGIETLFPEVELKGRLPSEGGRRRRRLEEPLRPLLFRVPVGMDFVQAR